MTSAEGLAWGTEPLKREGQALGGWQPEQRAGMGCVMGWRGGGGGGCVKTPRQENPEGPAPAAKAPTSPSPPQLNRSATLNKYVKRIRLPSPHVDLKPGTVCDVVGWGDTSNFGDLPTALMETSTTIIKRRVCRTLWGGKVSANMLCGASRNATLQGVCTVSVPGPVPPQAAPATRDPPVSLPPLYFTG